MRAKLLLDLKEGETRCKFAALEGAFAGNNGAGVGGGNPLYQSDEEEA